MRLMLLSFLLLLIVTPALAQVPRLVLTELGSATW